MSFNNSKELYVKILSDVRGSESNLSAIFKDMRENAQDQDVKDIFESLVFLQDKYVATLDQCFKMINQQPVKTDDKYISIFLDNFRKELTEIQSPVAKKLYIFSKVNHLVNFRISEYMALITMSVKSEYRGVGLLLESILAPRIEFLKHSRHLIRDIVVNE